jgi:hypothetical protein
MAEIPENTSEIAAALETPTDLEFKLPDPEDEELEESEFQQRLDQAWLVCERFDLQTDIWRGRILRIVRDREKKGGEGRGNGFLNWLKQREISKSQAYSLIQLADSADTLLQDGQLQASSINNFSKRAFVETAKSDPEVQKLVSEAAENGDRITRREVKDLSDQWTAMNSDLIPGKVKEQAESGSLSPRYIAPLAKEMEKLPESHLKPIQQEAEENPDVDTVKNLTSEAKNLSKYLDAAAQVQAIANADLDMEMALEEALRLDCLNTASDLVKQATNLEQAVAKLYTTWKRVESLADRLYVETGASNPHLRALLTALEKLSSDTIEVPLDETSDRVVRLKIIDEDN